jgi:hypothetical protein
MMMTSMISFDMSNSGMDFHSFTLIVVGIHPKLRKTSVNRHLFDFLVRFWIEIQNKFSQKVLSFSSLVSLSYYNLVTGRICGESPGIFLAFSPIERDIGILDV